MHTHTDFDNWLAYYKHNHPDKHPSDVELKEMYDRYYGCECITCKYRKERGYIPYNTGKPDCTAPTGYVADLT